MKKPPPVALVAAGSLGVSLLGSLEGLAKVLGPVKSTSLRVASRLSNALGAGHPVAGFEALESCPIVLISVPDSEVEATVARMTSSGIQWKGRLVVLCSNELGIETLQPLAALHAETASFGVLPGFGSRWFLLEGSKAFERRFRTLIGGPRHKTTQIDAGEKSRCVEAMAALNRPLAALLREASEKLRQAGVPPPDVKRALERRLHDLLRAFFRSGRMSKE